MGYIRAEKVLPADILELVQQYVDGQSIYIPRRGEGYRTWGDRTDTRRKLDLRNQQLYQEYLSGVSAKELAEQYYLTEKSIRRIIRTVRHMQEMETTVAK